MKRHFYHHLIEIDSIHLALGNLDLSPEEKQELLTIVETNINHAIMDSILSELADPDKKVFLSHVVTDDHDAIWKLLNDKIDNAQDKILITINEFKKKLHADILEAHKKN